MNIKKSFKNLTAFELVLWLTSAVLVSVSFVLSREYDIMTLIASLIGVTALIFVAKGDVLGLVLSVVFSVFYGIISFKCRYYGEMITYLGMTAPMAIWSIISWVRNPFKDTSEVAVSKITKNQVVKMSVFAALVTAAFYFILGALGTSSLFFSTISVTTSFCASYLSALRSPYYALAYAANDAVLIVLWIAASFQSISYLPMIICFVAFLLNDLYGFYSWRHMQRRQMQ
ncbi:MAG: nicotinamide riboside transporter PnuC [Oscillospiraceae bacterium]